MNLLDRTIAYLHPAAGARRAQARVRMDLAAAGAHALGMDGATGGAHLPVRRNWAPVPQPTSSTRRGWPSTSQPSNNMGCSSRACRSSRACSVGA